MRYLNKIVFINSASVKYAEIGLDGNVHLIGTQGVGKSTLLRAILFFYNANKSKLGISREKKRFDEYYFEYQNSYIIYEIVKDNIPFCVLAYKVNGKAAFRFFNSEYQKKFFIDENSRAFENWEKTRDALGKAIYYTKIISNYEEYRKIIYGDNKGLKSEFRKYALIESKQYQNIPRTIQNVLLNSNLEAKFIKDTIINSISEDEFTIDVSNYSKNHLRDFETQIKDIRIWFKKNKKGEIVVRNQADKIIDNYRILNFLKKEKKGLAINLSSRINYIEREKSQLSTNHSIENSKLEELFQKKENLKGIHLKREQKLISKIDYINKKLTEAENKQTEFESQNIKLLIEKVAKKESLINKQSAKIDEKNLLTSQFAEISQKYKALITQTKNQEKEFANERNAEINRYESEFGDRKSEIFESYNKSIQEIRKANQELEEKANNEIDSFIDKENSFKRDKAELKHKTFYDAEIKGCEDEKTQLNSKIQKSNTLILNSNNEKKFLGKKLEFEEKEIVDNAESKVENEQINQKKHSTEIGDIETKIRQSKSSLYGWLNDNVPNWEGTIGKVIDEKYVLFNTELSPKLIDNNTASIFGLEINLNALDNRIKTVKEYNQEIELLKAKVTEIQKSIALINGSKESSLKNLNVKFRKKLNTLKEVISTNEYVVSQSEQHLKNNKIKLDEWILKSTSEKAVVLSKIEEDLEGLSIQKAKAKENLENIIKGGDREISKKEKEKAVEINNVELAKDEAIKTISASTTENKVNADKRIKELKNQQDLELNNKGVDTERLKIIEDCLTEITEDLSFIRSNERTVFDYEKDKRELFDKVPELRADKTTNRKKQNTLKKEQRIEQEKFDKKYNQQDDIVQAIQTKIDEFNKDVETFNQFKTSDTFLSIQNDFLNKINENNRSKAAILIIEELNDRHYKSINKFNDLQQSVNSFISNFNEQNIFRFKVKLNKDSDFINFAIDLKEFIEEGKINQFEKRVNERFSHIIQQIGNETTDLISKEAEIEKIIKKINNDFISKNFVEAIKEMEMRTQKSSNPVVKLLIKIKEFNDENSLILGENNLFTSPETENKNHKAVELLKQLVKELEKYKNSVLTLSESFDLQFRIVENDNDSGWVEKLSNVGSEGTDVLVKAMINILLLNVFKDNASKKFKDFKLHCMMDEIGRLHPNNIKGILRFANDRNILLINGSPTSQNAIDYRYTYKLSKEQSKTDNKKYITRIKRLVKVNTRVFN
ncbi:ATP-binding protein [bacterium endosymbiont of Bathymodiolus sp. 5 South]|uniref:ATP-binding protein n=1 Tax=bacterium endosymbiont of Bathymodiolus sp. 5 South TaxID=1181670 RepID=UPI0010BA3597|nr:ATP-binding protein [bacterium endosymbiont of Bathymodiolus sp. 5 South]SHN89496.1 ATPase involved in DNA repair [bacterium endosymbiont of Bathymodiolus sp. 5 South]